MVYFPKLIAGGQPLFCGKLRGVYNYDNSTLDADDSWALAETVHIGDGADRIATRIGAGNGPTAILIHGIGSSSASWKSLIPRLQTHVVPVAIDLRGHGESGKPDSGYLYANYATDIDRVIDQFGLESPVIIGHSLGGIVALWWAAQHPSFAQSLVIVDSPLRSGEAFRPAFDTWIAQNAMSTEVLASVYAEEHPDWTLEQAGRRAEIMTGTAPGVFSELKADSMNNEGVDRIAELTGIQSPVLLVRGDPACGSLVHPEDADAFLRRMPDATVVQIPGAGHGLHRDHANEFLAAALPFIEQRVPRPRS